ncbi:MAG: energy transducer TonB [Gemmatimonadales bacterium]
MRTTAAALALLSIGVVTCADAQEPVRRCRDSNNPRKLPALGALLDSARAVGELDALPLPANGLVISLLYDEEDSLPDARPLATDSATARAARIIADAARPQRPNGVWAVRLRMEGGSVVGLAVQRSTYCPPVLTGVPARNRRVVVDLRDSDRRPPTGTLVKFIAEAEILEDGSVGEVRVVRSSEMKSLDEEIVRDIRLRRYLPALLDGFPVPGWYRTDGHNLQ